MATTHTTTVAAGRSFSGMRKPLVLAIALAAVLAAAAYIGNQVFDDSVEVQRSVATTPRPLDAPSGHFAGSAAETATIGRPVTAPTGHFEGIPQTQVPAQSLDPAMRNVFPGFQPGDVVASSTASPRTWALQEASGMELAPAMVAASPTTASEWALQETTGATASDVQIASNPTASPWALQEFSGGAAVTDGLTIYRIDLLEGTESGSAVSEQPALLPSVRGHEEGSGR